MNESGEQRPREPRLWIRLNQIVSQQPPESTRPVTTRPGKWIEVRGYVRYPGEENRHTGPETEWSFWESRDLDLSPIYSGDQVDRVYVEPGHEHAGRLREAGDTADSGTPFAVTVAEGPPGPS